MTAGLVLIAVPLVPLVAAAAAMAAPRRLSMLGLAFAALPAVWAGLMSGGTQVALPGFLFGARLGLPPDMAPLLAVVALVWAAAALHGRTEIADAPDSRRYKACFGIAMAGQFATLLARDMPSFYAGFAALGFAAYGLVAHKGTAEALRAGRVYIAFVVLGELALFAAFALIAAGQPGLAPPVESGNAPSPLAWWLLLFGFGVKAGLVPLHVWLPLAHPVAPVPASAALSGATLKAGLVGLMVFAPPALAAPPMLGETMIALGLVGAAGGALVGVTQHDAKVVLAYSSVSQMGLALALLGAASAGLADPAAARAAVLLFAVHHALAKATLFLGVAPGVPRPLALAVLALAALSLTGAPLTLGYAAKNAAAAAAPAIAGAMTLAAWGTAALMGRTLWLIAHRPTVRLRPAQGVAFLALGGALLLAPVWLGAVIVPKTPGGALAALAPALTAMLGAVPLARSARRWPALPPGDLVALLPTARTLRGLLAAASPPRPSLRPTPDRDDPALPDETALWRGAGYGMAVVMVVLVLSLILGAPGG
jgi:formate hydrogenlyase subunit 3/multisubunit Na+/H+ antiporter MnhD subunit